LTINADRREVRIDDQPITMKPREFELLLFLARNRGVAMSRDLIVERVWGWESMGTSSRTVDVHIRWLREKIEPDPTTARRIITVRGIGYRFDG
jgi:DNA-binding response OmpR family regulator